MTKQELLKTAKPIRYNTEMVRAMLDDRKSQTRRAIKPQPHEDSFSVHINEDYVPTTDVVITTAVFRADSGHLACSRTSKYSVGDILYVQETWRTIGFNIPFVEYKADMPDDNKHTELEKLGIKFEWQPSIHMPKEAARIFLRVTGVRAERLQEITAEDCIKEGMTKDISHKVLKNIHAEFKCKGQDARATFCALWDSIYSKHDGGIYAWDKNPWVWVYEFKKVEVE